MDRFCGEGWEGNTLGGIRDWMQRRTGELEAQYAQARGGAL